MAYLDPASNPGSKPQRFSVKNCKSSTPDKLQTIKTIFGISCKFLSNNSIQIKSKSVQCGYVVSTSAFCQGDPGSNPIAARKSCEVYPGLGILQPQWNPYPTLTPPSCWVRHVRSIGGPQYGLAVCHHSRRSGRRPQQQNPTWEWRQQSFQWW